MALEIKPHPATTRFPFINLEKALTRAQELFSADQKGREMTIGAAFAVWGYSEKSSGGFQTIAALKMYGLLKDSSGGDSRKVGLTDSALWYFRDERDHEKQKLAREFALAPKLIAALWDQWQASPPADPVARSHLKAERGLNDQGARTLLAIYKENLAFADLKAGDKVNLVGSEPEEPEMEQAQAPSPLERALGRALAIPPTLPRADTLQEVFYLDEGPVTLSAPSMLSPESYQDVADRLAIFLRGLKRRSDLFKMMKEDAEKGIGIVKDDDVFK
ncbi:hypothetical protein [Bradyrhizobium sp. OK095]|uniref:hypothetical protein n=1 Tax=Bradyrhizobium sp. OK095 TaxID=1882760 RepID=UPI0008C02A2C|nr:hypothetical protein [Bradyrhizobium sp. OK095]SEN11398.1 hypothetical protein SAMN05443254_10696 [Bradyrhizobium sp. OK095]